MSIKEKLKLEPEPLYLVDGHSLIYRAFYAFPDLSRSDGFPTNALFIVTRMLMRLLREERPKYLAFFLDGKGPSFRKEIYEPYKAQRPTMPEPLSLQIEPIKEVAGLMGFTAIVADGGEADDCIASMAARFKSERPVIIVGSDKDLKQCLDERVVMWDPGPKGDKIVTLETFTKETGLTPSIWPDYQALIGDSSDNIPGVPGVGPKTAQQIMADHPHLEDVRDHLEDLKPAVRKKIEPHVEDMFTYRELTRLRRDYCSEYGLKDLKCREPEPSQVTDFLEIYEFRSLVRELLNALDERARHVTPEQKPEARTTKPEGETQLGLWGEEEKPEVSTEPVEDPDAIPAEDAEVGLAPANGGFFVGAGGTEYEFKKDPAALAARLTLAKRVFAPDVKALIAAGEAWERIEQGKWFDLGLAAYLLSPEDRNYSWQRLRDVLARDMLEEPVAGEGKTANALGQELAHRLKVAGMYDLMFKIELPLIPVLARMEKRGVALDLDAFQDFLNEVQKHLDDLEKRIRELAGREFNLRSSQQLAEVLFDDLGLKPLGKTPGGAPSTSVSVLERLRDKHEIVDLILKYRTFEKLRSTYLEPLPKQVDKDGRVHTTFNQLATATGRLSSSGPNLQNIPIRGEFGPRMRACFTAGPGNLLVAADYSQIELRVLAHLSGEPTLIEAFRNKQDIHSRTAALLFEKDNDPGRVTPDERRMAKTINFGLIYGMGPQKLSRELSIPMKEAKEFIARYFDRLSGLADFYDEIEKGAREYGYVTTITGRRRLLPDIHSTSQHEQSTARRQAINTRVQGSAADIIKMAMIEAENDQKLKDLGAKLILQVHDELLLEAPADNAKAAGERLADLMCAVYELDVPLAVDHGVGRTWAEAH